MTINQISVFLENKSGRLAELTKILFESGVNLRALTIADTADFGIVRIVAEDNVKATEVLEKNHFIVKNTKVLGIEVADQPGGLYKIMELFRTNNVNIEYLYVSMKRNNDKAVVIFKVDDINRGLEIVKENSLVAVSGSDL
ncbi:MAG: amino acid-binding protein [Spirochaetia bacterium]|nr:amino acid-binding protein [Spirochaetia bacterium]